MKSILTFAILSLSLLTTGLNANDRLTINAVNSTPLHATITPETILFDEYKGKIVFIEVFGERCPHCIRAIPMYNSLYKKFPDKLGIITIEAGRLDEKGLKNFIKRHNIVYPTTTKAGSGVLFDLALKRGNAPGWVPYLLILDKNGKVHTAKNGPVGQPELEAIIEKLSK